MMMYYAGIGSRMTPAPTLLIMESIAVFLRNEGYTLRSGGADGADTSFESGSSSINEIYLPWMNFNGNDSKLFGVDDMTMEVASKFYGNRWGQIPKSIKLLMGRNVYQIHGYGKHSYSDVSSKFVVCWTKDGKPVGGTSFAMKIADYSNIPVYNLFDDTDISGFLDFYNSMHILDPIF